MIKLFIVDDHQVVIDGISSILSDEETISFVGSALNGADALEALGSHDLEVDVILMDINMPKMDGIEVVKQLRARGDNRRVLVLTMHNNAQFTKQLIQLGVEGCILKNAGKKELLHALEEVHGGGRYFGKDVTENLFVSIQKVNDAVEDVQLTRREIQIMQLIAKEYTTNEIAEELAVSSHTVDTHRKNIISKLGVKNIAGLVKFAYENDLI